jgi:hypothetical protein
MQLVGGGLDFCERVYLRKLSPYRLLRQERSHDQILDPLLSDWRPNPNPESLVKLINFTPGAVEVPF